MLITATNEGESQHGKVSTKQVNSLILTVVLSSEKNIKYDTDMLPVKFKSSNLKFTTDKKIF